MSRWTVVWSMVLVFFVGIFVGQRLDTRPATLTRERDMWHCISWQGIKIEELPGHSYSPDLLERIEKARPNGCPHPDPPR